MKYAYNDCQAKVLPFTVGGCPL